MPGAATTPSPNQPIQINAGDPSFSTTGPWQLWQGYGHAGGLDEEAIPGTGTAAADYSFTGLANTQYAVQITWPAYGNRATNTPYTIYNGSTSLGTYLINQQASPSGTADSTGTVWQQLGIVGATAGTLKIEITNAANGRVEADAVRIIAMPGAATTTPPPAANAPMIISAGGSGFSTVGPWQLWQGYGHAGGLDEEAMPGDGTAKADFTYTGLAPGQYAVSITWPAYPNRGTNVPYTIYDGSTVLGTYAINQQASPVGTTDASGTTWQTLNTVTVGADGLLQVELTNAANGRVEADAVMIQAVTSSKVVLGTTKAPGSGPGVSYPGGSAADDAVPVTTTAPKASPRGPRLAFGPGATVTRVADDRRTARIFA